VLFDAVQQNCMCLLRSFHFGAVKAAFSECTLKQFSIFSEGNTHLPFGAVLAMSQIVYQTAAGQ